MPRKAAKRYPPLPKSIEAPSGPISIEFSDVLDGKVDTESTMGQYDYLRRLISIRRKMPRRQQWHTLFHEYVHLWLHDSGITNGLNEDLEEAIADAISTGLMRERFGA